MRPVYAIYVEEQLIDLDPKTIIALTLQMSDFASGDLTTRKASFTNQIKVPASQTNIKIFQFANNPKSGSTFPYLKKAITIYANGIRILDGVCIIKSFDTYFNLQIYSTPKDLSFRIANLYLSDLDFGDSPITWDAAFIESKRASTSSWCAPVIDYGQMDASGAAILIGTWYLPSISYKDTFTAILTNAGYTVSGSFYDNDPVFNKLVLTYARKDFLNTTLRMNEALSTTFLQSDFIKDFFIRFGAFFRYTNNNIEIITYERILSNTSNAIDWTNKRVRNKKDIVQYTWGSLAKINNFIYDPPDNDPGLSVTGLSITDPRGVLNANGSLTIDNEVIGDTTDLYTSIFNRPNIIRPSTSGGFEIINGAAGHICCATSSVWESAPTSYTFEKIPNPMIALLCPKDSTESACTYNGTSYADFLVARFSSINVNALPEVPLSNATQSLGWKSHPASGSLNGFLDVYYNQIQLLFDSGLITETNEYNLTDLDINNLDLTVPIYDDGRYHLINKINSYVSYKTTRVELLKI